MSIVPFPTQKTPTDVQIANVWMAGGMRICAVENCGTFTLNPDYCTQCQEEIDAYVHADRANAQFSSQPRVDCGVTVIPSTPKRVLMVLGAIAAAYGLIIVLCLI